MALSHAPLCLWSIVWLFVHSDAAANLGRSALRSAALVSADRTKGHVITDTEPTILDFSNSPFTDSVTSFVLNEPFKTNPKNGTPWYRYTKTAGRGRANHSHFGGLTANGDFPEDVLHSHNVVRERAGVEPLEWSSQLHEMAETRVLKLANEGCFIEHSPTSDRMYEAGFEYIGENLYKVINMKPTGVDIVDAWYAEIEDYTYGLVGDACVKEACHGRAAPPCTLGHFTQVMWAKSTHVGCARAECPDQAKRTFIAVCNYGPGGNIVGNYPFTALSSMKLGLGKQDCRMRPKPEPSLWEEVKQKSKLHSGTWRRASAPFLAIALLSVAIASA